MRRFILTAGLILLTSTLAAQRDSADTARPRKLGIVLSGGGAKGLAHIGVLKVLEEEKLYIEVVTGTSMGAIVGGLYAIGYSPAELERIAVETDWVRVLSDRVGRKRESLEQKTQEGRYIVTLPVDSGKIKLPESLVTGQLVSEMLSDLTLGYHQEMDFRTLPIPFACVAADIETGEPVMFDKGVLAEAIRASMSIPTVFKPLLLNGRTWVDGGITRNLPAVEALELGANVIIAVDVSSELKKAGQLQNLLDIMEQTVSYSMSTSSAVQAEYCDMVIKPDMQPYNINSYNEAAAIIKAGEDIARRMLPEIRRLADSLGLKKMNGYENNRRFQIEKKQFTVTGFEVKDNNVISTATIRSDLNLKFPSVLSLEKLEEAISRVYGSGYFTYVRYRLVPDGGNGWKIILNVVENRQKLMRFGFRFDSYNRASLLLNATRQNVITEGGQATLDFRIGDDLMMDAQLFLHTGYRPRLGTRININAISSTLDVYDDQPRRIDNVQINAIFIDGLAAVMYRNWLVAGAGGRAEMFQYRSNLLPEGGTRFEGGRQWFLNVYGLLWMDKLDRSAFPRSGFSLQSRLSVSNEVFFSPKTFAYHYLDGKAYLPVSKESSLFLRTYAGMGTGPDYPAHYRFYLGGANTPMTFGNRHVSYIGLPPVERSGQNIRFWQTGIQYEFMRNRFIQVVYNEGSVFADWQDPLGSRWIHGGGLVLGGLTPFGPIDFTIGASSDQTIRVELNAGFRF